MNKETDKKITLTKDNVTTDDNNFKYVIVNNEALISNYVGSEKEVTVPFEINGYQVIEISTAAFAGNSFIEKVIIGNGVKVIGYRAFEDCTELQYVHIPDSVVKIDDAAFHKCKNLNNVVIPNNITVISNKLFSECNNLSNISLPDNLISIGDSAFECTNIESFIVTSSVTELGECVFEFCKELISVHIYGTINKIKQYTFYGCSNLISVTFSNDCMIKEIQSNAFGNCIKLTKIILPNSIKNIYRSAFCECEALSEVIFPQSSVISVDENAFWGCCRFDVFNNHPKNVVIKYDRKYRYSDYVPTILSCILIVVLLYVIYFVFFT